MPNSVPQDPRAPRAPSPRDFSCMTCHRDGFDLGYMVHDSVAVVEAGLAKKAGILCLECLAKKIGRPLTGDDFILHAPVNTNIFYGLYMAGQTQWWEKHKEARKIYEAAQQVKLDAKRKLQNDFNRQHLPSKRDST